MYNILIVDDEKIERNGIRFLLKKLGIEFNVSEAQNGKAALEYITQLNEKGEKIDILLTDVKMPFMDGIELIRTVKDAGYNMKNIIFSGYNEFEYAKLAVKLGVVDYILKPVNPKEFETTITKVIHELDEEMAHIENENKRNDYIKEYLLYSLINGKNKNDADSVSRLQSGIDENVWKSFWNVYDKMLFIEFNQDFFGKIVNDFAVDVLNEISQLNDYQYINLNQQQAVIMMHSTDDVVAAAEAIHRIVVEKFEYNCCISVSRQISDYNNISSEMEYLEQLMESKFYYPEVFIFTGQKDIKGTELIQIDDDTLMKQIKQSIKMKDITGLRAHFDRLSSKYHNQSYFSHIYVKFIFSNLLKIFYENSSNTNEDQFNKEIEKLYTSDDLNAIIDIINGHIDEMEKSFKQNPQMAHREIEIVKEYIYNHYSEELGVDQLAEMVYLTPSYLSAVFKKETGQNLSKFIKQYRMEKAKDMLENTNKKIVVVSNETGYVNVSYFCQSFREYYGISPQKFREQGSVDGLV